MGICDGCFRQISIRENSHTASRIAPMDVIPDEILPGLYIGAKESAANLTTLTARNIKRVLVCGDSLPQYHERDPCNSIAYLRLAIADSLAQSITEYIPYAMEFIKSGLDNNEAVLVHCNAGQCFIYIRIIIYTLSYILYDVIYT